MTEIPNSCLYLQFTGLSDREKIELQMRHRMLEVFSTLGYIQFTKNKSLFKRKDTTIKLSLLKHNTKHTVK